MTLSETVTDPHLEQLSLRPAVLEDAAMVFKWRNLPFIVEAAAQKGAIGWEGHQRWFTESVGGTQRSIFIVSCDEVPAGQVRFDWADATEAHISLYLLPEFTGRGLGVRVIRMGCQRVARSDGPVRILAWVRQDNAPSRSAFRKAGFTPDLKGEVRPGLVCLGFTQVAQVPHNRLTIGPEEEQAALRVVRSGRWAGGAVLADLEARMALTAGVTHAVGVGSGVGALRLALLALDVKPGDAVAVPAYSCVALANAVLACGAEPVPVDVDSETWNISVPAMKQLLARRRDIRAAIAVHTFGCPAPVREIEALGVPVVEDCSHAFGLAPLGRLGRVAMLSLYATKLIGAGEGGVVLTGDGDLARKIRSTRDYVDQAPSATRLNDKMTDLEAALALCQLDRLPKSLARRTALARRYTTLLSGGAADGRYTRPVEREGRVWYRYVVGVDNPQAVVNELAVCGVTAAQPVDNWCSSLLPVSATAHGRLISLPLYPTLTDDEQDRVVAAFLSSVLEPVSV